MKKALLFALILCCGAIAGYAQKKVYKNDSIKKVDLYAVIGDKDTFFPEHRGTGCLDLLTGRNACGLRSSLRYGGLRVGNYWDWLQISMARDAQTRMVSLGGKKWEDALNLPVIKVWPKLRPGQERSVTVDASGSNGRNGSNAGGGISDDFISSSNGSGVVSTVDKKTGYDPFQKAVEGNMYLVRVFDETNDYYVLFRVDELKRGQKCTISWRKLDIPAEKRALKF
jgi:hypothetical protein